MVPEGAEMMPRPNPDYPILPSIPLSAFSDPKKIKSSHAVKVSNENINCNITLKTYVACVCHLISKLIYDLPTTLFLYVALKFALYLD